MKKLIFRLTILLSALILFPFQAVEACTGFIVGKNLTADGSTLYGRTEDLEPHHNKVYKVHPAQDNKAGAKMIDEANGFEWQLPARSYKYTSIRRVFGTWKSSLATNMLPLNIPMINIVFSLILSS